jgi:hypothetical protein
MSPPVRQATPGYATEHQHCGAEPDPRGLRRQIGQKVQGRRNLPEPGEMMLDQKDAVKTERLGLADVVDVIGIDLAVAGLLPDLGTRAANNPKRMVDAATAAVRP